MRNHQNSSNNSGIGNIGNNINTQKDVSQMQKDITQLKADLTKIHTEKVKPINYLNILIVCVAIAIFFWVLVVVFSKLFSIYISDESAIITIVGILATFIVVSNYAQVKDIENKFDASVEKTEELEKIIDDKIKKMECLVNMNSYLAYADTSCKAKDYSGALDAYFNALNWSKSLSQNEILPCITIINSFLKENRDYLKHLSGYYIDLFLSILNVVDAGAGQEMKSEINNILNDIKQKKQTINNK